MAREQIKMGDLVEQREREGGMRELEMVGIPRRIRHSLADFRVQLRTHSMKGWGRRSGIELKSEASLSNQDYKVPP